MEALLMISSRGKVMQNLEALGNLSLFAPSRLRVVELRGKIWYLQTGEETDESVPWVPDVQHELLDLGDIGRAC